MVVSVPVRYVPRTLKKKDRRRQVDMLLKSRRLYKKGVYYTRNKLDSYDSKKSIHVMNARKMYKVDSIKPSKKLAKVTGCSIDALKKIVKKGVGAYFSSGSRPNQTGQSWGIARLASAITSGKAAAVDYDILERGCDHGKKAFKLAVKSKRKYGYGHRKTKKVVIK